MRGVRCTTARLFADEVLPRFREEFALPFGLSEQSRAQKALHHLPRIYTKLPGPLRYVGPWREAQARLSNHAAGFITHRSNRFWIGQPRMPFAD